MEEIGQNFKKVKEVLKKFEEILKKIRLNWRKKFEKILKNGKNFKKLTKLKNFTK